MEKYEMLEVGVALLVACVLAAVGWISLYYGALSS